MNALYQELDRLKLSLKEAEHTAEVYRKQAEENLRQAENAQKAAIRAEDRSAMLQDVVTGLLMPAHKPLTQEDVEAWGIGCCGRIGSVEAGLGELEREIWG